MATTEPEKAQNVRRLVSEWGDGLQTLVELDTKRKKVAPNDPELKAQINSIASEFGRIGASLNEVCIELAKEEVQVNG